MYTCDLVLLHRTGFLGKVPSPDLHVRPRVVRIRVHREPPSRVIPRDTSRNRWNLTKKRNIQSYKSFTSQFVERSFSAIREKMSARKPIAIKLLCPSLSKVVRLLVASDEQRIDLGCIARAFGLDPSTIKLNDHFISRGVDLVASSVTWKSLLSFFSAKGLPTGKDDGDALDVTGKLFKAGKKRGQDSQDAVNVVCKEMEGGNFGRSRGTQLETIDLLKNKKLRESNPDGGVKAGVISSDTSGSRSTCRNASQNLKRMRDEIRDEAIVAARCKRIR